MILVSLVLKTRLYECIIQMLVPVLIRALKVTDKNTLIGYFTILPCASLSRYLFPAICFLLLFHIKVEKRDASPIQSV